MHADVIIYLIWVTSSFSINQTIYIVETTYDRKKMFKKDNASVSIKVQTFLSFFLQTYIFALIVKASVVGNEPFSFLPTASYVPPFLMDVWLTLTCEVNFEMKGNDDVLQTFADGIPFTYCKAAFRR